MCLFPLQKGGYKSCAEIHQELPQAESGYYWVMIGNREAQVYCDMENYGKQNVYSTCTMCTMRIALNRNQEPLTAPYITVIDRESI